MKKTDPDDLRPEYRREDLGPGVRGKYLESYRSGTNLALLHPDVAKALPADEAAPSLNVSETGGLLFEQYGRHMRISNTKDANDHKQFALELKAWAEKYHEESARVTAELEEILHQFNTFDILANVSLANLFIVPDKFEEPSHKGFSAYVEFIALVALKGSFVEAQARDPRSEDLKKIQDLVDQIFSMHFQYTLAQSIEEEPTGPPSPLETLQFAVRQNELMVRGPAYPIHLFEVLEGLFSPFDTELLRLGGFSSATALGVSEAMNALVSNRLAEKGKSARVQTSDLLRKIRARKRDTSVDIGLPEKQVKALIQLPDREIRRRLDGFAAACISHGIGQTVSFTANELANQQETPVDQTEALLRHLSAEFGSVDSGFFTPTPDHLLKNKPLLHHEGRYLCPTRVLLNGALLPTMEGLLTTSRPRLAERYRKHRHDLLLQTAVERLLRILPGATSDMKLHYQFEGEQPELDALIQYDSVLLLLEAKGAPLTPPARRGAPDRLKRDLRRVVADAHKQGHRAFRFLSEGSGRFAKEDGTSLEVDLRNFEEVFVVSLHLEPIGHLTALSHAVDVLGLTTQEDEQSWMVSLYDLMVLADIIDIPSMLPHYIKRRLRVAKQGFVNAHDELDLFCYYLQDGLFFDDKNDLGEADSLTVLSHTVPLDDYYFYIQGERRQRAEKPKQKMRPVFESLVKAIEASQLPSRTSVNIALLDQGGESRRAFCDIVRTVRKRFAKDGKLHDGSVYFKEEGGWGVTFMCGPEEKMESLHQYCNSKRDEMDAKAWYGIADRGRRSPQICGLVCAT